MSKRTLLEANEELLLKEFLLPENAPPYEPEELNKILGEDSHSLLYPAPGICVKTKTDTGEKVFINICTSEKVPTLRDISEERLLEIVFDQTNDFSHHVCIGERLESDKAGKPCLTYDAMINKDFFQICRENKTLRLWMILGILDAVSGQSGRPLNREDFVVLKNLKAMGKLRPQKFEAGKQPSPRKRLIEEIDLRSKDTADDASAEGLPLNRSESSTSNYVILRHPREGPPTRLIGLFRLPEQLSAKTLSVDVAPDRLIISHEKSKCFYDLFVPFNIHEERSSGVFYKDEGLLRLDLPIQP